MNDCNDQYAEALKAASNAFQSAHDILVENDINVLQPKIKIDQWDKVRVPKGHIRKVDDFIQKYDLNYLLADRKLRKNIAYSLQTSDFINFLHNRFNITLSVGSIFYKLSILNIFSILEAIIYGILNDLHQFCTTKGQVCNKQRNCQYYVKSIRKLQFNPAVDLLMEKRVLNLKPSDRELLFEYNDLRNNVHIFLSEDNEFLSEKYNRKVYNKLIFILRKMSRNLRINLLEFEDNRDIHCKTDT